MENDYYRVEQAIRYIADRFPEQPLLEDIAASVHLSPYHFQRMFTRWAGVSPKKFMQYLACQRAKVSLDQRKTLFDTAIDTGLSGTGRLHDLFITIEAMTPGEFKKGGEGLSIQYSVAESVFGQVMVASTERGICNISFLREGQSPGEILKKEFPGAGILHDPDTTHLKAMEMFNVNGRPNSSLTLNLKGTPFQVKVWEALLKIPDGDLKSYSDIAASIGAPNSSRAVGSAVAKNPVAYLIPCHRVIRSTGEFGNYRWGAERKVALIGREAAQNFRQSEQEMEQKQENK